MPGIYACAGVFDLKPGERGRKRRPLPRRPAGNARVLPHPDPAYFDAARLTCRTDVNAGKLAARSFIERSWRRLDSAILKAK